MRIAVVAANGRTGRLVVDEALRRGHEATAVVRGENRTSASEAIVKDLFELERSDLEGFDVVVDAFAMREAELLYQHTDSLKHLCDLLSGSETRLVVVGGAGSLFTGSDHVETVADTPGFPDAARPLARAMASALEDLRQRDDVAWTYLSPALVYDPDGERTGRYVLGGEERIVNEQGVSRISYADYAIALMDVVEAGSHVGERISVIGS